MTTRSNSLISALNTNALIQVYPYDYRQIYVGPTYYFNKSAFSTDALYGSPCNLKNSTAPAGFYLLWSYGNPTTHFIWPEYPPYFEPTASAMVDGFFGGCTSLDALLASTFDCLYNINCLELFATYFPVLNDVCII